jgi:hypothetical protein
VSDPVQANIGQEGFDPNVRENTRDLILCDKERAKHESFNRLKAQLTQAFAVPDSSYHLLAVAEIIAPQPALIPMAVPIQEAASHRLDEISSSLAWCKLDCTITSFRSIALP